MRTLTRDPNFEILNPTDDAGDEKQVWLVDFSSRDER